MVHFTHPVRHCVPVARGQGLQGPPVLVNAQPVGLPSGQPGAILPHGPAAPWTICILPTHPIGLYFIVEK